MPQNQRLALVVLALLAWFLPLGGYRLFNPDEGRYADIPRQMVASGDWVTPRLDAIKYFEKPPLHYWATAAAFEAFGQHDWSARLWVALCGFVGLLLTARIGGRLYGPRAGLVAACVQGGSLLYLGLARISTLDMGLSITLELALVGLLELVAVPGAGNGAALVLALGISLSFLSKGLVGILIPVAVAGLYWLVRRDWSLILRVRPWWTALALAVLAGPWVWLVSRRNPEFAHFFFVHEHFERFLTRVHARYEPDWFFIPVLLLGFMPFTPLLPAVARRTWAACRAGEPAAWMLALWVMFVFAFFSLSQSKLIPYILPLFPALALLSGRTLDELPLQRLARALWVSAFAWLVVAGVALALWLTPAQAARLGVADGPAAPGIIAAFGFGALASGFAAAFARRIGPLGASGLAACGTLLLLGMALPAADQLPRQREFAGVVAAARSGLTEQGGFYCVDDYDQSIPYYLGRACTLVGYRGELDFGLQQEPWRWLPDHPAFAARWQAEPAAVAVVRASSLPALREMGLPMRVIYTSPSLVVVVRQ
jgi:4-amino-4-deoxy-L-arabinose transferase-like glycosyltransferase